MSQPKIDLTKPGDIVKEIFDADQWIKDKFTKHFSSEILELGKALADSFVKFPQLDAALVEKDEQADFVISFVHGVFDDLLTSMKLLVTGKLMASGNLMRQAIEGMAVALLCSSREPIHVYSKPNKNTVPINYWEHFKIESKLVETNKALGQLKLNYSIFGLSQVGIEELNKARNIYHQFSHPSMMGIASRMALGEPGSIFVGGGFDEVKLSFYKKEIEARTALCRTLPKLIDALMAKSTEANGLNLLA